MSAVSPVKSYSMGERSWILCANDPSRASPALPDNAPPSAVLYSNLTPLEGWRATTGHAVKKMIVNDGSKEGSTVYFKQCDPTYPPLLAQIESALSASYRITRGLAAARIKPVVDSSGVVVGSASFELQDFQSMMGQHLLVDVLLKFGVAEELVARYVRMEDDLHPGNVGTTPTLGLVDIDFDMSLYSLTSELKGPRIINNGITGPLPVDAFYITNYDIDHLPNYRNFQACYSPAQLPKNINPTKVFSNREEFRKLANDPRFTSVKYFAFLKEVLIDLETHLRVMEPHFSNDPHAVEMKKKVYVCIEKRWQELEERLILNQGFREFLLNNSTAFQGCLEHFKKYNSEISEGGVIFDLDLLQEKYQSLVRKCMAQDLTLAAECLVFELNKSDEDWGQFKKTYYQLIDILLEFQKEPVSFHEAFFFLEARLNSASLMTGDGIGRWEKLCEHLTMVIGHYRGLVIHKSGIVRKSVDLPLSNRDIAVSTVNVEACLAKAMHKMLHDPKNNKKILKIAKECLEEYKPLGYDTTLGYFNFKSRYKVRVPELEKLITDLRAPRYGNSLHLVSDFIRSGAWNAPWAITRSIPGYLNPTGASANVILISKLCEAVLKKFKRQITLEQLRSHDLVQVCYEKERGKCDFQLSAQKIAEYLQKLVM